VCVTSSDPADCAIDVAIPHEVDNADATLGWNSLTLTLACGTALGVLADFVVSVLPDLGEPAPVIVTATPDGFDVHLMFDRAIDPGAYTCVTHVGSGEKKCLGFLPGDANLNLASNGQDIQFLVENLRGEVSPPILTRQCDLDRSDACTPLDVLTGINLLNGAEAFIPWLDETLPACPSSAP
jgi:hypothetical protein